MALVDGVAGAGQSNDAGRGDAADSPTTNPAFAREWNEDTGFVQLADPGAAPAPYKAQTGSMFPAWANAFTAASGRPMALVRTAVGGTPLLAINDKGTGNWSPTGTLFNDSVTRIGGMLDALDTAGDTLASMSILWHQGERDVFGTDLTVSDLGTQYQAALEALPGRYRTALGLPDLTVYVHRIGGDNTSRWVAVRAAQDAACASTDGLVMAYTRCVEFAELGWMKVDNLHYLQAGLNDMGATSGAFVAADMGFTVIPTVPTRPPSSRIARHLMVI